MITTFFKLTEFCPVFCKENEQMCPGPRDHGTGKQTSPDYCLDKDEHCPLCPPVKCSERQMKCPTLSAILGFSPTAGPHGCPHTEFCHNGSKYLDIYHHIKFYPDVTYQF